MESAYFGPQHELFGMYYPALSGESRLAVLLGNLPFGEERVSWLVKNLALNLSHKNVHVFRFDLYGCGNSSGDVADISLQHWLDSVQHAHQELSELSSASTVCCVGLRFLAALQLGALHSSAARHVVYDPILSGAEYLASLDDKRNLLQAVASTPEDLADNEYAGQQMSRKLLDELAGFVPPEEALAASAVVADAPPALPHGQFHRNPDNFHWETLEGPLLHAHKSLALLEDLVLNRR